MDTPSPPRAETWNLRDLLPDDEAFDRAKREWRAELLPPLGRFKGRLLSSPATLADALDTIDAAKEQLQILHCYAALRSDGDTRVATYQAMRQEASLLSTEFAQRVSYVRPEILAAAPDTVYGFLEQEPRLAPHAFFLRDLMRRREHVLTPPEERILAESGLIRGEAAALYSLMTNAELPRPEITLSTGETARLTTVGFQRYRTTPHRPDRLAIFPAYFRAYADFRETLGRNLSTAVKEHVFNARVRGYGSCLRAALDPDNVPERVYRNLIRQVRDRLPLLRRLFSLRGRALGLDRLEYADLYCPLTNAPARKYSTAEARDTVLEALAPLGERYRNELDRAFRSRWIDWHPAPGKRSGAYATGWAYAVHPYVLLNFNGDYESVSTLAHEMGHAMHSHFSNRAQPFATAEYSIFVAEVASTLNEALLMNHALATARGSQERLFLLGSYLDGIRGTLFRQTMFAEFELAIHERAERGEPLTGERFDEIYRDLLQRYHAHDGAVVHVAGDYAVEWAAVPHMYYDFYVYQYATGIVAATALARTLIDGEAGAAERCMTFLASGGSDDALQLLRRAGVDLESHEPYRETFELIDRRLDELEALLDSPGAHEPSR